MPQVNVVNKVVEMASPDPTANATLNIHNRGLQIASTYVDDENSPFIWHQDEQRLRWLRVAAGNSMPSGRCRAKVNLNVLVSGSLNTGQ